MKKKSKLSAAKVAKIKKDLAEGKKTQTQIAIENDVSGALITFIKQGKIHSDKPEKKAVKVAIKKAVVKAPKPVKKAVVKVKKVKAEKVVAEQPNAEDYLKIIHKMLGLDRLTPEEMAKVFVAGKKAKSA